MRKFFFCFILLLFFCSSQAYSQLKTPLDSICKELARTFIEKDSVGYIQLVLTSDEFKKYIIPKVKSDTIHKIPSFMIAEGIDFYESGKLLMLNRMLFYKVNLDAKKLGLLDWSQAKCVGYTILSQPDKSKNGLGNYVVDIQIDYMGVSYVLYGVCFSNHGSTYRLVFLYGIGKK